MKHLRVSGRYTTSAFTVVLLLLTPTLIWAQGASTIVGTVTDPSGAVIPNAAVQAVNQGTGQSRDVTTNAQGYFVIPSLQPSTYDLSVKSQGYADYVQKGITLLADQSTTFNVKLSIQQAQEVVTIE